MSTSSASIAASEEEYEVEKILNKKIYEGTVYYKVKWIGHDEPTWEAAENCECDLLIKEFERRKENLDYEEEDEWEVEAILNKRIHKGKVEYLVKWRGWPGKPTWEIADNCECINLIAAYENPKLKKILDFRGSNKKLWASGEQVLAYMENYIKTSKKKVNLLKFEPGFPPNEKQLPLKEGLNIGPLCYENHWYLVMVLIDHICVDRQILVGDSLNTLIGTNALEHPVIKRLKRVYTHFLIQPVTMTQMNRSDVCAFYTLAAFERALYLYNSNASFVAENIFFNRSRAEVIRGLVKPGSDGEISVSLRLPASLDHGPMCEFCEQLHDSRRSVDEHINQHHFKKKHRVS